MTPEGAASQAETARTAREAGESRPSSAFDAAVSRARSSSVTFATPRSLALPIQLSAFSPSPFSASLASSTAVSQRSLSPAPADTARSNYEMSIAIQRREFEQRFLVYQKRVSADSLHTDNVALREQLTVLKQQIAIQEIFLACQRSELANFHYHHKQPPTERISSAESTEAANGEDTKRQQQQEGEGPVTQQAEVVVVQPADARLQPYPSPPASAISVSSASSVSSSASVSATTAGSSRSQTPVVAESRPVSSPAPPSPSPVPSTPSLSGLFDAVIKSELASRPASRLGTASSQPVAQLSASPFADLLFESSPPVPDLSLSVPGTAAASRPADGELTELLALTDTQLSQAEDELLLERAVSERLTARVDELERRVEELQAGHVLDTREIRAQLELRAQVCSRQEEALHRLTFENRSLIQQLIDLQQQQPSSSPSSHHLPPASSLPQPGSSKFAANAGREMIAMAKLTSASAASSSRPSRSRFIAPPSPGSAASSALHSAALGLSQDWKPYGASLSASLAPSPLPSVSVSVSVSGRVAADRERRRDEEWKEQLSSPAVPTLSLPAIQINLPAAVEQPAASDSSEVIVSSSPRSPLTVFPPLLPAAAAASAFPSSALPSSPLPAPVSSAPASIRLITQAFEPPPHSPSPQQLHLHDAFYRQPPPHAAFTSSYLQRQAAAAATEETKEQQEAVTEQPALDGLTPDVVPLGATIDWKGKPWPSGTEREAEHGQLRSSPQADGSRYVSEKGAADVRSGDDRLAV